MSEIRYGFKDGLTMEQAAVYADPKFNSDQMHEIRAGFKDGLNMGQVMTYADPKFNWKQMQQTRLKLGELQKTQSAEEKPLSINDRLNVLEAGKKLASVTVKEDIVK